jgi:hypothetical protein
MQRQKVDGKKPQSIQVDSGGFVTGRSANKPQFEDSIRRLCTKYMDVSIVLVKNQNPQDMADLRVELGEEFEYLGNQLSFLGLKEAVRCALKYERSCLKGLWEKDPSHGSPLDVSDEVWQKLKLYWNSPEQVAKSMV